RWRACERLRLRSGHRAALTLRSVLPGAALPRLPVDARDEVRGVRRVLYPGHRWLPDGTEHPWVARFVDGVMTDTIWTPRYANAPSVAVYVDNGELLLTGFEHVPFAPLPV